MIYTSSLAALAAVSHAVAMKTNHSEVLALNEELLQAIEGLMGKVVTPTDLDYLRNGVGTATDRGKAILAAQRTMNKAKQARAVSRFS